MKILAFFIVFMVFMFTPGFSMALDLASQEVILSGLNKQPASPEPSAARSQQGSASAPANNSPLMLNALYTRSNLRTDPDPVREMKQTDHAKRGILEDWREQMFKSISLYYGPRQQDLSQVNRLRISQANDGKIVTRLVVKETLKFTRARVVLIDKLVNALKFEVSSETSGRENAETGAHDRINGAHKSNDKTGAVHPAGNAAVKDRFILKTGVRVRIDSGKLGLLSETEARYGGVSYFYKVNLDNQGDNSMGFRYVLGKAVYLQVERDFTRTMNPIATGKPNTNLIQVGCRF